MISATKNLNVLFIVENNNVPPDIRVWREARTAKQAGYCVTVISPKTKNYPKSLRSNRWHSYISSSCY